jgi:hypothetical protein
MNRNFRCTLVALMLVVSASAHAGTHPCAALHDGDARLACYDRAFPPAAGSSSAVDHAAERERALKDFGLTGRQLNEQDPQRMGERAVDRIEAAVTRISYTAEGKRVVGLDNGQTWLLTEATSRGQLQSGDRVTVRNAALGSFMLVTPRGIALRARRTR